MKALFFLLGLVAIALIYSLLAATPVYFLWNWLMPEVFGLKAITWWQALGLSILCCLLFKSQSTESK